MNSPQAKWARGASRWCAAAGLATAIVGPLLSHTELPRFGGDFYTANIEALAMVSTMVSLAAAAIWLCTSAVLRAIAGAIESADETARAAAGNGVRSDGTAQ